MSFFRGNTLRGLVIALAVGSVLLMDRAGISVPVAAEVVRLLINEGMSSEESQTPENEEGEVQFEPLPEHDGPGFGRDFLDPDQRLIIA